MNVMEMLEKEQMRISISIQGIPSRYSSGLWRVKQRIQAFGVIIRRRRGTSGQLPFGKSPVASVSGGPSSLHSPSIGRIEVVAGKGQTFTVVLPAEPEE